jgi:hypothetical protein
VDTNSFSIDADTTDRPAFVSAEGGITRPDPPPAPPPVPPTPPPYVPPARPPIYRPGEYYPPWYIPPESSY